MNGRPDCECHQEPATRKGDGWTCTVRNREANARHHAANRDRLATEKRDARQTPGAAAFEESHHPPLIRDRRTGNLTLGPYTIVIEGQRHMWDEVLDERDLPEGMWEYVGGTPHADRTDAQHRYAR
jgi:hypothetical protein